MSYLGVIVVDIFFPCIFLYIFWIMYSLLFYQSSIMLCPLHMFFFLLPMLCVLLSMLCVLLSILFGLLSMSCVLLSMSCVPIYLCYVSYYLCHVSYFLCYVSYTMLCVLLFMLFALFRTHLLFQLWTCSFCEYRKTLSKQKFADFIKNLSWIFKFLKNLIKIKFCWSQFFLIWSFKNLPWDHVRSHTKFRHDRFGRFDVYWIHNDSETDRQTDKQSIYIDVSLNICYLYYVYMLSINVMCQTIYVMCLTNTIYIMNITIYVMFLFT